MGENDKDIVIDEGDMETFLKPSKADDNNRNNNDSSDGKNVDRRSQLQGFGESFSSIKDLLSVGSIQENGILEDDQNATFTAPEAESENDPASVQALIDSYFSKLESKRSSTGSDNGDAAAAAASAMAALSGDDNNEKEAKQLDDLNQVESYFNRIDSRTKLSKSGRRAVRSRRRNRNPRTI